MSTARKTTIGAWFRPLLVGTFLGAWGFATVSGFLKGGVPTWMLYLFLANAFAAGQVMVLGLVDIVLLKAKVRALPTGREAWLMAMAIPAIVGAWRMFASSSWWVLGPMFVVSVGVRLVFGRKTDA